MTSPVLSEAYYSGGFLISEMPGHGSRDVGTISNGTGSDVLIQGGTVLAQNLFGTATVAAAGNGTAGANTGTGTLVMDATTPLLANAQVGTYTLKCITAGTNSATFRVTDPRGDVLGDYAFSGSGSSVTISNQLKAVLTDAATDFIVGDGFAVTVPAGSGWSTFVNGVTQTKLGVAWNRKYVPASGSAKFTIMARNAEVAAGMLQYDPSLTGGALTTAKAAAVALLLNVGIVAR